MPRLLKALPLTLATVILSIVTTSCGANGAQARFVNAIEDTVDYGGGSGGLDVYVNGGKPFSDITFGSASASTYTSVASGSDTIAAVQTGSTPPANQLFSQAVRLNSGSEYTLVATGLVSSSSVVLLTQADNNREPADGTINFRVINASPSGPQGNAAEPVDIYLVPNTGQQQACSGTPTISSLAYQQTSPYVNLNYYAGPPGSGYIMYVCLTPNGIPVFSGGYPISVGSLNMGSIRTLILPDQENIKAMSSTPIVLSDLN